MAGSENIRADMQVIASDGGMVGTVDGVEGERIKLKRASELGGGGHHFVPTSWVARVDDHVHLDREAALVRDSWQGEGSAASGAAGTGAAGVSGAYAGAAAPPDRAHQDDEHKTNWLPWLIGLALVAALLFFIMGGDDNRDNESVPVADTQVAT